MNEQPVIITGGGIGGLTTAIAIGQTGRAVLLVERAPRFEPIGYGIQIGPNALHVLERLGLAQEVLAHSSILDRGILSDALNNTPFAELPMGEALIARFGQPYAVIHRGDLHEVLVAACEALPSVQLRNDFEVAGIEDTGTKVIVTATDGTHLDGACLIAADGIWSTIRNQLFPGTPPPFTSRYAAFRCLRPVEEIPAHLVSNVVNLRCGDDFHMIHYPLRNGTLFNLVAGMRVPDHIAMDDRDGVVAHFEGVFANASDEVRQLLPFIDRSRFWAVSNLIPLHRWTKGRVALTGDSAHAMVQAMAQGACQAIEDAFVMAKHLDGAGTIETAFARFEEERRSRATYVQYRSLFMWELIHARGGWRDLRKEQLGSMTGEDFFAQLDWLYSAAPGSKLADELSWAATTQAAA
jgi:3-hydroxybenzoate 6-monooxygenase